MEVKEYLQQLQNMDIIIKQRQQQLKELTVIINNGGVGGVDYTMEKVQTSPSREATFSKIMDKLIDLQNEISQYIVYYFQKKNDIIKQIQSLDSPKYVDILYKKYIEFKKLDVIACEMCYSCEHIKRIHKQALNFFNKKYVNLKKPEIKI